jgi:hypothetical protein
LVSECRFFHLPRIVFSPPSKRKEVRDATF